MTYFSLKRKVGKRNFSYREVFRLLCVKGFASMRSMLAGVAETGSAPPQAVRDCFFTTLQPLRGFRHPKNKKSPDFSGDFLFLIKAD